MAEEMRVRFRVAVDGFKRDQVELLSASEALRYIDGKCAVPVRGEALEVADAPPAETAEVTPWTMQVEPAEYLERFPDGPNAELARMHLTDAPKPADPETADPEEDAPKRASLFSRKK